MRHSSRTVPRWLDDAGVAHAFQMAVGLPTRERVRLRVGVLSVEGVMVGGGVLRGFEQAGFLRDQLQILGFSEHLPSREEPDYGCDLVLKQQPRVRDTVGPDVLRRARPLWPPSRREGAGRRS